MGRDIPAGGASYRAREIRKLLDEADNGDYRHVVTVGQYAELKREYDDLVALLEESVAIAQ